MAIKSITKKNLAKSQNLLGKEIKILKASAAALTYTLYRLASGAVCAPPRYIFVAIIIILFFLSLRLRDGLVLSVTMRFRTCRLVSLSEYTQCSSCFFPSVSSLFLFSVSLSYLAFHRLLCCLRGGNLLEARAFSRCLAFCRCSRRPPHLMR